MLFEKATNFNEQIGDWDTSKVTSMRYMFYEAENFNNGAAIGVAGGNT